MIDVTCHQVIFFLQVVSIKDEKITEIEKVNYFDECLQEKLSGLLSCESIRKRKALD